MEKDRKRNEEREDSSKTVGPALRHFVYDLAAAAGYTHRHHVVAVIKAYRIKSNKTLKRTVMGVCLSNRI